ncbi:MAG: thiamine pyrophosphate-dependent enzyme, partial [Acholeplasmataceae bacterium]
MPKKQYIDPEQCLTKNKITFKNIPINAYDRTLEDEKKRYSKEDFLRIYHDMVVLREFESMLLSIKVKGEYEGHPFTYPGPAHLSMGQEAAAVGQAYLLEEEDLTFGSHRSHSEVLARGLSAINKLDDERLLHIMENFSDGETYRVVKNDRERNDTKDLAIDFLLYGALAEIFAKRTGFHKGMGGSMHVFFQPFGIYPNNAIVGGSAPIATGAALFKKVNDRPGIVIANFG